MADLVTVFELTRDSNGIFRDAMWRLAIGLGGFAVGGASFVLAWKRKGGGGGRFVWPVFVLAWSSLWILMHDFPGTFGRIDALVDAYAAGRCEIVEGEVAVRRQQAFHGHSSGDLVVVAGREFEVNYFRATPAYSRTLAHGGALGNGVHARICHLDGEILRLEVRRP